MTGNAALFLMVETGDVAGVRTWLSQGGDPNSPRARDGSLLHYGAICGHVEVIRLLLANGALVDDFDSRGDTPLFTAVGNGHTEAARLLLNHGAKVAYTFQLPDNAAERARVAEERNRIRSLVNGVDGQAQLRALLDQTPQVMRVPLHCTQSIESAALLLDRGANPTLRDQASFPCWQFVRNPDVQRYLEAAATVWEDTL